MLRRVTALLAVPVLLAACSSGTGHPVGSPSTGTSSTGMSSTGMSSTGTSGSTGPLSGVTAALGALTSAHLDIDAGSIGGSSNADVTLRNGATTAVELHTTKNGKDLTVVTRDGTSWLQTDSGWVKIAVDSPDATAKSLSNPLGVVTLTNSLASLKAVGDLLGAAATTDRVGEGDVNGVHATEYTLAIDPKQLSQQTTLGQLLALVNSNSVPVDVALDDQHRPVKIALSVSFAGQKLDMTVGLSKFGAPLSVPTPS